MPKVIYNLRERIIGSARAELLKSGYDSLAIRTVANECGIAVGTVYNYFPSKSMLAAEVMLDDWRAVIESARESCLSAESVERGLAAIYEGILSFYSKYSSVWANYTLSENARSEYGKHRNMLVGQIAATVSLLLKRFRVSETDGLDVFIAENIMLCVTGSNVTFDTFTKIITKLLYRV